MPEWPPDLINQVLAEQYEKAVAEDAVPWNDARETTPREALRILVEAIPEGTDGTHYAADILYRFIEYHDEDDTERRQDFEETFTEPE